MYKVGGAGSNLNKLLDEGTRPSKISDLEKQFDEEMRRIYFEAKKFGMYGDAFIGLIEEHGGRRAAKLLIRGSEKARGAVKLRFIQMIQGNGLNLTAEYLVAQPRWAELFKKDEIRIAKQRIEKWK